MLGDSCGRNWRRECFVRVTRIWTIFANFRIKRCVSKTDRQTIQRCMGMDMTNIASMFLYFESLEMTIDKNLSF